MFFEGGIFLAFRAYSIDNFSAVVEFFDEFIDGVDVILEVSVH